MTNSTNFISGTKVTKEWLNDVDSAVFDGTTVYTPSGTGAITTTVQSKLRQIVSASDYDTLINAMAVSKKVTILAGANINLAGFTVPSGVTLIGEGDATITLSGGITMSAYSALKNLHIVGGAFNGIAWVAKDDVEISGCHISGTTSSFKAIVASGANTQNRIIGNIITGGGRAIDFVGSDSVVDYNLIDGCGNTDACILITGSAAASSNRISVSKNVIKTSAGIGHGIQIYGGDSAAVVTASFVYYIDSIVVEGNQISDLTGAGIWTSIASNVSVSGNVLTNVAMEGIDFEGSKNCTSCGNTLLNCGATYGALACFHGSYNCSFVGNAVRFEGKNTAFTSGSCHTTVGPLGTSVRNSSSYWGYVRDDCTNILFDGNTISNDATANLTEFISGKGATSNHSTRGVLGLTIKNNRISGGCIIVGQECDYPEITGNSLVQTFDTFMPIQVQRCNGTRVKNNSIYYAGSSASAGINQAAIRVGQFNTSSQRTQGVVVEGNEVYGYPSTGIAVDTYFAGAPNPDLGSFSMRGNKAANLYFNTSCPTTKIIEGNHSPVTFAVITAVGS